MEQETQIYQTKQDFKNLTEKISKEKQGLGIGAIVLTSMIDKKYLNPEFQNKRKDITKDLSNVQISARLNQETLRIGFYSFDKDIPIIFEYFGPQAKTLYDLLNK